MARNSSPICSKVDELPRIQLDDQRHQHSLAAEFAFAARAQMLLEQHALVRHMLVNDPESFAIHRNDEAAVHLPKRLQVGDRFRLGSAPPDSGTACEA